MANVFTTLNTYLSKLEAFLIALLTVQAVVVDFVTHNVPAYLQIVSGVFWVVGVAVAVIKAYQSSATAKRKASRFNS